MRRAAQVHQPHPTHHHGQRRLPGMPSSVHTMMCTRSRSDQHGRKTSPPNNLTPFTHVSEQVFSLAHGSVFDELNMKARSNRHKSESSSVLKITEEGALFRSYRDGRRVLLTPESSVQAQKGACAALPSMRWGGKRCV